MGVVLPTVLAPNPPPAPAAVMKLVADRTTIAAHLAPAPPFDPSEMRRTEEAAILQIVDQSLCQSPDPEPPLLPHLICPWQKYSDLVLTLAPHLPSVTWSLLIVALDKPVVVNSQKPRMSWKSTYFAVVAVVAVIVAPVGEMRSTAASVGIADSAQYSVTQQTFAEEAVGPA